MNQAHRFAINPTSTSKRLLGLLGSHRVSAEKKLMKPIPHASCPQCGELRTVTNKLQATNLYKGEPFIEAFEVVEPQKFASSPYTRDDYFVDALFCRACEIAFIPEDVAEEMGIGRNTLRGTLKPNRPYGLGAYVDDADSISPHQPLCWRQFLVT